MMRKLVYILLVLIYSCTSIYAAETLSISNNHDQHSALTVKPKVENSEQTSFTAEWIALLGLAVAGFALIYRSTRQINKIKKLQNELNKYHKTVYNELDSSGGKNV